ncbi:DUF1186 domain-containing protein [Paenibacillus sp. MZ04-78.2]|uniref:DUF1186 domain-containing protein n=1 Tax=Paenibacillus sp. MZ04-78.2 TaxID=2962034 RepID=UPI0020B8D004|nr:DUF1186 domain-containing protein [Paenibacillus sp. MZ04-78.2]MCP3776421.1 DUF1186 domain-containing protein [Paenibacillus sp. MZ04-78.2]
MEQILQAIRYNNGKFPRNELQHIIEQKEEAIPYLLQIMNDLKDDYEKVLDRPTRIDFIYAYFLLAQFQVKELFPIMIDVLSKPSEICENIFDDAITEGIGRILASVYNGEIDLLLGLIENTKANQYARGQALNALVVLVLNDHLSRDFVMDYFKQLMNGKLAETNYYINAEIVCCCEDLYPEEVLPDIQRLYEDQVVESTIIRLDSIEKTLQKTKEDVLRKNYQKHNFQLITSAIEELQDWACFRQDFHEMLTNSYSKVERSAASGDLKSNPAVKVEKIGRNDPCTCGSGQKYKKCCGR